MCGPWNISLITWYENEIFYFLDKIENIFYLNKIQSILIMILAFNTFAFPFRFLLSVFALLSFPDGSRVLADFRIKSNWIWGEKWIWYWKWQQCNEIMVCNAEIHVFVTSENVFTDEKLIWFKPLKTGFLHYENMSYHKFKFRSLINCCFVIDFFEKCFLKNDIMRIEMIAEVCWLSFLFIKCRHNLNELKPPPAKPLEARVWSMRPYGQC